MSSHTVTTLSAVIADYPHTMPLKNGQIRSDMVALDFTEMKPVTKAFKPMVREQRFDVSELALATFLQAKAYNKPLVMLRKRAKNAGIVGIYKAMAVARRLSERG